MKITVILVGRVPGGRNVRHFSLSKSNDVAHLNGQGFKSWLEIDLGPAFREPLNMTIRFDKAAGVVEIVADNKGLTSDVVGMFRHTVEVNFRNLD
jgi:hypothetical protein